MFLIPSLQVAVANAYLVCLNETGVDTPHTLGAYAGAVNTTRVSAHRSIEQCTITSGDQGVNGTLVAVITVACVFIVACVAGVATMYAKRGSCRTKRGQRLSVVLERAFYAYLHEFKPHTPPHIFNVEQVRSKGLCVCVCVCVCMCVRISV